MVSTENRLLHSSRDNEAHVEFIRLWSLASRRVHVYIATMIFNVADAEDLLQEVGVTAWERFQDFDRERDFVSWACGIARNKVLSFNRISNRQLVQTTELLDQIEMQSRLDSRTLEQQHEALRLCLLRISEQDRHLLQIRYSEGKTLKRFAEISGKSLQAIYKSFQRIHVQLFECMKRRIKSQETR